MARNMTADEALAHSISEQHHKFSDITSVPMTITPDTGRRIVIQSWQFKAQSGTGGILTFASAGVDSVVYRGVTSTMIPAQGFPYFAGLDEVAVTITLSGMVPGTYAELLVGYLEI